MSKNCFVKTLNVVVDNPSIHVFDGFYIPLIKNNEDEWSINRVGGYDVSHPVRVQGSNCTLWNSSGTIEYSNPYNAVGDYAVTVKGMLTDPGVTISNIKNMAYFSFMNTDSSGHSQGKTPEDWELDCSVFQDNEAMLELGLAQCTIKAKTSDFAKMTSLTTLKLASVDVKVNVDLVDLVQAWIQNGRSSSGSITGYFETGCKFNGVELWHYHTYANRTLTWESATKMYLPAGSTMLCVGYSDEEIATNTGAGGIWEGKTVVKCD